MNIHCVLPWVQRGRREASGTANSLMRFTLEINWKSCIWSWILSRYSDFLLSFLLFKRLFLRSAFFIICLWFSGNTFCSFILCFWVSWVTDTLTIPICLILFYKHVQLLTQIHLLASSNPALSSEASTTKMFLVRMCLNTELHHC